MLNLLQRHTQHLFYPLESMKVRSSSANRDRRCSNIKSVVPVKLQCAALRSIKVFNPGLANFVKRAKNTTQVLNSDFAGIGTMDEDRVVCYAARLYFGFLLL